MTATPAAVTVPVATPEPISTPTLAGFRLHPRAVAVSVALLAVVVVGAVATFTVDGSGIPLVDLLAALGGDGTRRQQNIVDVRLPRLLVALGAGAALSVSGSIFQSVSRNPLGSPDVIGLSSGSAAGAAAVLWASPQTPAWIGATFGALLATALVRLGAGRGFLAVHRMILTGIGVAAIGTAVVQYAVTRMGAQQSQNLVAWVNGSLSARNSSHATIVWIGVVVLIPLALGLTRQLTIAEMGDETAWGLGVSVRRTRSLGIVVAVALAAVATAVAGPIAFVALTAPQIARRLARTTGPTVVVSTLTGAALLVWADIAAQHLPFPRPLPVGILTAALGGIYLVVLLTLELRKGSM
ncbi:MAG: FecCD family ABC transporter permease [Acidimicrobiia bacterium]